MIMLWNCVTCFRMFPDGFGGWRDMTDHADKRVRPRAAEKHATRTDAAVRNQRNQEVVRQFAWTVASINVYLQEIRYFWAKALGISGPQWMILMALADIDQGEGASVKAVS